MLTLKSLTFQNIGRFVESQTIDFTRLGSLVQVDGQNNVTSGSSGAGKSTIFKALSWLLGLEGPSTTVLQSRLTKEHIQVSALFDFDGQPLKIERGKKLLIDLNGEVTTGSSKLTEEKLDEIIGMDRGLFSKILHKKQGESGFFLEMGPSDIHKFFTKCLSLDKEQNKIATLDLRLEALFKQELKLRSDLESNNTGLEATQNAIKSLGEAPVSVITLDLLENLKQVHTTATNNYNLTVESLRLQMEEFEKTKPLFELVPYDRSGIVQREIHLASIKTKRAELEKAEQNRQSEVKTKISELQIISSKLNNSELTRQSDVKNQISAIQVEISKLKAIEQDRQIQVRASISNFQIELLRAQTAQSLGSKAKVEAASLIKELEKVRSALCPTCDQNWVTDAAKVKEVNLLAKLSEYKKTVLAGNEASNQISELNNKIESSKTELQLNPNLVIEFGQLNAQIVQLKLDLEPRVVPEVVELSYQIEHLKSEVQADMVHVSKTNELAKEEFLVNSMLGIERKEELNHQFTENARKQAMVVIYDQKQTDYRKKQQLTAQEAQNDVSEALQTLQSAEYQFKAFGEAKAKFEESIVRLIRQTTHYLKQINTIENELLQNQEELGLAQESRQAIKSYLSCSFEDTLESIGDSSTRLIRNIPNMSTATIQFDGLKENKDGKVKEEVNAIISMDGEVGIPVKSLSGGERSSTDLAIDLAVIQFIEERTQKGISVMILDEPFTGLDTVNVFEALEMLKACSCDKQLLIVDHNPVAAQSIESRITVVRDGLTSRVVQ